MAILWAALLWIQVVVWLETARNTNQEMIVKLRPTLTTCVCVCLFRGRLSWQPWARQADDTRPCPWPWHG